ncbi:sigma factor [Arthrobacter sp. H14-L1]|uniref:sigma factor n=1 Tax=Arthrobacter sp. H14-L1 TaxID=2996697 RepID=UPI00226EC9E9|nr:sigma factor [Arthrobacter sp. H14-L1]MCY0906590.1 hypothetical protein [Arthrobacter sp. H14-L1]
MTTHALPKTSRRKDLLPPDFQPGTDTGQPVIGGDEVMTAVEDISRFVRSRLAKAGCLHEVDDVLQDIRMAVWAGVTQGHYQSWPGVRFGAWVQGIANHVCAASIAKASAHYSVPLFVAEDDEHPGFDRPQDVELEPAGVAERDWALDVLRLTKQYVGEEAWGSALFLLMADHENYGTGTINVPVKSDPPAYRRARQHLKFVRQMATTIRKTLAVIDSDEGITGTTATSVAECLPTELHRTIAATIIVPRLSGPQRSAALTLIAEELDVTPRYVAVQIGRTRSLHTAALRLMRDSIRGQVVPG